MSVKRAAAVVSEPIWLGTEASFLQYIELECAHAERLAAGWGAPEEEEDEVPYLLSIEDGIGRIKISGPMTNEAKDWHKWFNIATYPAIREALVYAASAPEVEHILLDVNSGGGTVNGVSDVGNLIRVIHDHVKPVTAFTDGAMLSGAYWLGVSAGEIHASNVAMLGSIGVLMTHMDVSQMYKDMGISVTVLRSGKYKALGHPMEPLTKQAQDHLQGIMDVTYKIFVTHVSQMLGMPYDYVQENLAQGREFIGEQAVTAGLAKSVTNYDAVVSRIKEMTLDNGSFVSHNPRNLAQGTDMNKKKALTAQDVAILAAGGSLAQAPETPKKPETEEKPEVKAEPEEKPEVKAEAEEKPEVKAEPEEKPDQQANSELVVFLQTQVAEKDQKLIESAVTIKSLESKVADMAAASAGLVSIAAESLNNMRVALGMTKVDMAGTAATELLAEHARLAAQFQSKFPVGGVAAVDAAEKPVEKALKLSAVEKARLDAVRPTAKA